MLINDSRTPTRTRFKETTKTSCLFIYRIMLGSSRTDCLPPFLLAWIVLRLHHDGLYIATIRLLEAFVYSQGHCTYVAADHFDRLEYNWCRFD